MSAGGDAADQMVQEGIQITESAVKLAGLGAKNLVALLLALLREHQKLKGKSSIDRLLHDEKQLSIFHVKKADLPEFTKLSKQYGVLFHPIYNKKAGRGLCDIMVKSEDASKVNRILEVMQYPAPGREGEGKNAPSRAPQEQRLTERGNGLTNPIKDIFGRSGGKNMDRAARLEALGPEVLAALVLHIAKENMQSKDPSDLSRLLGQEPGSLRMVNVKAVDAPTLELQARALGIPLVLQETGRGEYLLTAPAKDAPLINRLFERQGLEPPMREEPPEKAPAKKGKQAGKTEKKGGGKAPQKEEKQAKQERPSVRDKIQEVKEQAGGGAPKQRGRPPKAKAPKAPTMPVR